MLLEPIYLGFLANDIKKEILIYMAFRGVCLYAPFYASVARLDGALDSSLFND